MKNPPVSQVIKLVLCRPTRKEVEKRHKLRVARAISPVYNEVSILLLTVWNAYNYAVFMMSISPKPVTYRYL